MRKRSCRSERGFCTASIGTGTIPRTARSGKVSGELQRRGIAPAQRLRVVVELKSIDGEEPSYTAINAARGAFDWLAEEPLYSNADLVERFRS